MTMSAEALTFPVEVPAARPREGDVNIATVAALLADPARAMMLMALSDGRSLPAGELARRAHIAPSTASAHLRRLVESGFVSVECWGRHRYFHLTSRPLAEAIEALARIAPATPIRSLREADISSAVRYARTCYDHLAGYAGVRLTQALVTSGYLEEAEEGYQLTPEGKDRLRHLGIAYRGLSRTAVFVPYHIDWSERRHHIAGPLAVALTHWMLDRGWFVRAPSSRAVRVTDVGRDGLRDHFGAAL